MIPNIRLDREQTRYATLVIRSLMEFKPELFGLPPFPDLPIHKKTAKRLEDDPPEPTDDPVPVAKETNVFKNK